MVRPPDQGFLRLPDIFDELNEDLRAERARALFRRYGVLIVALVVLVVAGVGSWKGWEWWQDRQSLAAAGPYMQAMRMADDLPPGPSPARLPAADAFARLATTAPVGYRTLARLREASLRWDLGDTNAALALWDQVSADGQADPQLRDLGSLLWAQHSLDKGDPAAIAARTAKLEMAGNPWRALAQEVDALLAVKQNDNAKAIILLRALVSDPLAADGLRGRANGLLTLLGGTESHG
jgi:hypothetical protein